MIDLISDLAGGRVIDFNDEFFAEATNLIKATPPVWKEGEYTEHGKWMDGWETRRRRDEGHDWCVVALGIPGRIKRVTVDTSFFTGNYPEQFSLDVSPGHDNWFEAMAKTDLEGDSVAVFDVDLPGRVELVRLNIYPDGGVARLRIEGDPIPAMQAVCPEDTIDLASARLGGRWLEASDFHYSPPSNLLAPTESRGMWDGWETRRRRGPGHDWATFQLGVPGVIDSFVADSTHFKGNCPGWVSIDVSDDGETWDRVVDHVDVSPHNLNQISLSSPAHAGFVRLCMHPDGGLARFRVLGRADRDAAGARRIEYLNSLFETAAEGFFRTACSASGWVKAMVAARPFTDVDDVQTRADSAFDDLTDDDWLEAFAGHPRIGERGNETEQSEQAGSVGYEAELAEVNSAYEEKFGFVYLVYATGKTGPEMLEIARERLHNTRQEEIANAAGEQRKITATRLAKMLCQEER